MNSKAFKEVKNLIEEAKGFIVQSPEEDIAPYECNIIKVLSSDHNELIRNAYLYALRKQEKKYFYGIEKQFNNLDTNISLINALKIAFTNHDGLLDRTDIENCLLVVEMQLAEIKKELGALIYVNQD